MSSFLGADITWAIVAIVVIPAVVILAAELDERFRQRQSPLRPAVQILRTWALPSFAAWTILAPVLGLQDDSPVVRAVASALVLALAVAVLRVLRVVIGWHSERRRARSQQAPPQLLLALPRLATILVVGWILVNGVWGVDLSGLLTALGVTSLVISFALQDTLSGLASGLVLVGDRPFETGDWIEAGDLEGLVVDVNWRSSRIRDRNGDMIVVPNGQLANSAIVNHSAPTRIHRVVVSVQVAYANPPTLAKAMLLDAATSTPGVLSDPPPFVAVVQVDDPLMGYEVQMWVDDYAIAPRVSSDFGSRVWYQSHRHNVPLPSPAQDLYLYDGPTAGATAGPSTGDIHRTLAEVPILATLAEDQLDLLARSARAGRYLMGEAIASSSRPTHDLLVIVEGRADIVLTEADGRETVMSQLGRLETVGLIEAPVGGGALALHAVTDCEVIVIEASTAGEVASRNADIARAGNRMAEIRLPRVCQVLQRRVTHPALPAIDDHR
ncbi:MAG: mechanosensitive ion channel [Actinomycetia bacterium]|nr:mechanosensitive ion channel [Actinomycetes bacterium]